MVHYVLLDSLLKNLYLIIFAVSYMIRSMTGYGMAEKHTTDYSVKVELRSLNGKYLDLNLRVPRFLMSKEIEIRNTFGKQIERGSATLSINVVKHKVSENDIQVNDALASQTLLHPLWDTSRSHGHGAF